MDNPAPPNRQENETIISLKVSSVSFLEALVTQTDWKSQHSLETWYGHHYPLLRTAALFLLFSALASVELIETTLPLVSNVDRMNSVAKAQRGCVRSLCGAAGDARFSCVVDATGQSASILSSYNGSYAIPVTSECSEAFKVTNDLLGAFSSVLNEKNEDEDGETPNENEPERLMIRVFNENEDNPPEAWLEIVPFNCSITFLVAEGVIDNDNFALVNFDDKQPDDVVENVLDTFVCPEAMSEEWREGVGFLSTAHEYMLGPAIPAVVILICLATPVLLNMMLLMWTLPLLVLTTFFVRLCFRWPRDFRGRNTISFTSTYKTLLLLCMIYECPGSHEAGMTELVAVSILAISSYVLYHNKDAAVEWVQLGVLWYTWSSVEPYLDSGADFLRKFDGLGLFEVTVAVIGAFVPGYGWWKLFGVYIFWRAFPRATNRSTSELHDKRD